MKLAARMLNNPTVVVIANAGAQSVIRFASNVILARMLMPTAFALTSITMLIMSGIQMVSDVGIAVITLRHGPMDSADEARMWTMQMVRGLGLSAVILVIAPPTAAIYGAPELFYVLAALCIVPTIQGMQSLYPILALAKKDLMPTFWVDVFSRIAGTTLSVLVAVVWPSVWALVVGIIMQATFGTLISHWLAKRGWPKFAFDWKFIRGHWQFSRWIQLGSTLTFIASQIDKVLFPLLFGLARFGVYGIGANFALIPAQITQRWSASIFYPLMVQNVKGDDKAKGLVRSIRTTMLLYSAVIVTIVIFVAPAFFFILYKPLYKEAGRFAVLLAAAAYFEVAESSLRHFPLADKTARFEFIAVLVRLSAFGLFVAMIWYFKENAELYAMAFTGAQATSYFFMLLVCTRMRYVRSGIDLVLAGLLWAAIFVNYAIVRTPISLVAAIAECLTLALVGLCLVLLIFRTRGLPALSQTASAETIVEIAQAEQIAVSIG